MKNSFRIEDNSSYFETSPDKWIANRSHRISTHFKLWKSNENNETEVIQQIQLVKNSCDWQGLYTFVSFNFILSF